MKLLFKYLFLILSFFVILFIFLPKENLYYSLVNKLQKDKISISHKDIKNKFTGLLLNDVTFRYTGIKMAVSDNIDITTYIIKSSVIINNTKMDSIVGEFMPMDIYTLKITHNIMQYDKLNITSKFDGGALIGYIDLSSEKIFLKIKLSKEFENKYKLIMMNLKKDVNGQYFIYESKL